MRVLSESGVQEAGKITLSFDPAYETLALHKLILHRDGQSSDRLPQQEIKVLQQEEGLDRHLYDGRLSVVLLLEDIRVGDTIEYAYSIRGANPIFAGRFMDSFSLHWTVPVHRQRYRLLWPPERKLTFKTQGETIEPAVAETSGFTVYTWDRKDVSPVIADEDLPVWFDPYGRVQLTEFQTWKEVAQWANGLYVVSDTLPEDLLAEVATISKATEKKVQAIAALRFVQNNIRYLGMEVGVHGYKPYPVETVWKRRFGDCKDKALLLCAILRQLGMEAYPALVETDLRHTIAEMLPTAYAFDHLVVNLRLDGRDYWMDPTMNNQGGTLDQLYFPAYGKALVISNQTENLADVTPGGHDATLVDVTSEYELGESEGEIRLKVHTVFRGLEADRVRSWVADTNKMEFEKALLNYYAKRFPEITATIPPQVTDNLETNELTTVETYRISNFWHSHGEDDGKLSGEFSAMTLSDRLSESRNHARSMPLRVLHRRKVTETILVEFPKAGKLKEANATVKDPAFNFSYVRTRNTKGISLRFEYETLADHVEPKRVAEYLSKVRDLWNNTEYGISISRSAMEDLYGAGLGNSGSRLTFGRKFDRPDAANPSSAAKGFLLAPFFLVGGIGVVWAVRRYFPGSNNANIEAIHTCRVCGCTEHTAPNLEFRVSTDGHEYCRPHLPR